MFHSRLFHLFCEPTKKICRPNIQNKKSKMLVNLLRILHILIMISVFVVPIAVSNVSSLSIYLLLMTGMLLHWGMNYNNCILTIYENEMKGVCVSDSDMLRIIRNLIAILLMALAAIKIHRIDPKFTLLRRMSFPGFFVLLAASILS